jgi:hypothetical protein
MTGFHYRYQRYQSRKHPDDTMARIQTAVVLTDISPTMMAQSESASQVPGRSRFACASVVSVAVGCASNRRRSIGSPVSSQ